MGLTHFLTKTLERVSTEMSLHVLAYNLKRVMSLLGVTGMSAVFLTRKRAFERFMGVFQGIERIAVLRNRSRKSS